MCNLLWEGINPGRCQPRAAERSGREGAIGWEDRGFPDEVSGLREPLPFG